MRWFLNKFGSDTTIIYLLFFLGVVVGYLFSAVWMGNRTFYCMSGLVVGLESFIGTPSDPSADAGAAKAGKSYC